VPLTGRPFRAENVPVVACPRRHSMVLSGRVSAGRWGSRCGPFTVSFDENEDQIPLVPVIPTGGRLCNQPVRLVRR